MSNVQQIKHEYKENLCELKIQIKKQNADEKARASWDINFAPGRYVHNIRNCDVFIEDYYFLIYLDVQIYKFKSARRFDMKDLKNLYLYYNTKDHTLLINLPCLPVCEQDNQQSNAKTSHDEKSKDSPERTLDLWKLKKITHNCFIKIDNSTELLKPECSFDYGFASKFRGCIRAFECDLELISRMPDPHDVSPLQRTIDREIDEMKDFSAEQYKLNFVELQIPEGHDNPINFIINFKDTDLTSEEQCLLYNITSKRELMEMPDEYDLIEIDCGIIGILLGICYDVRFTSNEQNCESAWTRSVLSATLTYFEPFTSLKEVVISFMRRSLIYPLYRNYELSQHCVEDCITALQSNSPWILKQLLITRDIFNTNERSIFNHYYIDDYIRYLRNIEICPRSHLQMLAYNLKNVFFDITKTNLGLGLKDLERELLKELITDIHISASNSEDDSEDPDLDDNATESCESEIYTSTENSSSDCNSSSDTEEDSVIEQKMDNLKL